MENFKEKKIRIIGTGYVGLTNGAYFAYLGHKVICVNNDKNKIQKLKKGIVPIFESGLEEILEKHRKDIDFTTI
jgi:UDPglucose 6-dehydrogenase